MSGALTGTGSRTVGGLFGNPFGLFGFGQPVCVFGRVNLLVFIAGPSAAIFPPVSEGVIGQVTTFGGATIPLVQTRPTPFGTPLSSVDNQFAVVCGTPTLTSTRQLALDVTAVIPLSSLLASGGLSGLGGLGGFGI